MPDVWRAVPGPSLPFAFLQVRSGPHENFHYLVAGGADAALVDPAFHVAKLFEAWPGPARRVRDALVTHMHWDHAQGLATAVALGVERVHVHQGAAGHPLLAEAVAAGADICLHDDGDVVALGDVRIDVVHTPGHQPESTCYLVHRADGGGGHAGGRDVGADARGPGGAVGLVGGHGSMDEGDGAGAGESMGGGMGEGPGVRTGPHDAEVLLTGDTLFIGSCGRTDFAGGDTQAMFASMARLRAMASAGLHVMPGHDYGEVPHRDLAAEAAANPALAAGSLEAFARLPFLRG